MEKAITQSKYRGLFLSLFEGSKTYIEIKRFYKNGFSFSGTAKVKPFFFFLYSFKSPSPWGTSEKGGIEPAHSPQLFFKKMKGELIKDGA